MPRLREEFDADRFEGFQATREYPTTTNTFEVPCSICGRGLYVDEDTGRDYQLLMQYEFDNKFMCFRCEQEYDDLAHT